MKWAIITTAVLLVFTSALAYQRNFVNIEEPAVRESVEEPRLIYAQGRVEGKSREINLFSTITERIEKIAVTEGDFVRAGSLLIQLNNELQLAEIALAESGVAVAQAKVDRLTNGARPTEIAEAKAFYEARVAEWNSANSESKRIQQLAPTFSTSQQEIDEAVSRAEATRALMQAAKAHLETMEAPPRTDELEAARGELASAKARLRAAVAMEAKTRIAAPSDGQVLQINCEAGELATSNTAIPLVVICDSRRLTVRANIDEMDALQVEVGQIAEVQVDGLGGRILLGKVSRLRPKMDRHEMISDRPDARLDSRARQIWIDLPTGTELIIGLPVDIWIKTSNNQSWPLEATSLNSR